MSHFDVFNGDADGICALHQLRLAAPRASILVTGVKRDIELLRRIDAQPGDSVTVLDVSLERNRADLLRLLERDVHIEYFDHHYSGPIPQHRGLVAHIDPAPGACTSTVVDQQLEGRHRLWAIVGAFGDNLDRTAGALGRSCGVREPELAQLRELGQAINYNGYGDSESDLLVPAVSLYRAVQPHVSPFEFIAGGDTFRRLSDARQRDLALARATARIMRSHAGSIHVLPDTPWARRVHGEFANELAGHEPAQAHAVLCESAAGSRVSVRAPLVRPEGADRLCRRFPTGGGRAAAGGIDILPSERLPDFVRAFDECFDSAGMSRAR